jgi:hypothetical protein
MPQPKSARKFISKGWRAEIFQNVLGQMIPICGCRSNGADPEILGTISNNLAHARSIFEYSSLHDHRSRTNCMLFLELRAFLEISVPQIFKDPESSLMASEISQRNSLSKDKNLTFKTSNYIINGIILTFLPALGQQQPISPRRYR